MPISAQLRKYHIEQLNTEQKTAITQAAQARMDKIILPPLLRPLSTDQGNYESCCNVYFSCYLQSAMMGRDDILSPGFSANVFHKSAAFIFEETGDEAGGELLRNIRQAVDQAFTEILGQPPSRSSPAHY